MVQLSSANTDVTVHGVLRLEDFDLNAYGLRPYSDSVRKNKTDSCNRLGQR